MSDTNDTENADKEKGGGKGGATGTAKGAAANASAAASKGRTESMCALETIQIGRTMHPPGSTVELPASEAKRLKKLGVVKDLDD